MKDELYRNAYYEKIWSLEDILRDDYIGDFQKDEYYVNASGKTLARYWVELHQVSVYNKETWRDIFEFFVEKMDAFERFYYDFEDFIKDV